MCVCKRVRKDMKIGGDGTREEKSEEEEEGRRRERAMGVVNAAARIVYLFFFCHDSFSPTHIGVVGEGGDK